jgi:hypothetical protein
MSDQASFHEGYGRALKEVLPLIQTVKEGRQSIEDLEQQVTSLIDKARSSSGSAMASSASGHQGY